MFVNKAAIQARHIHVVITYLIYQVRPNFQYVGSSLYDTITAIQFSSAFRYQNLELKCSLLTQGWLKKIFCHGK